MKKLCIKIRLSLLWIPYIIILSLFHLQKSVLIVFGMLMIHEIGHIIISKYLGIMVTKITIYPFGVFADFDNFEKYPSWYELYVAFSGPLFHILNFIVLNLLYQYNWLSLNQLDYYQMINIQMCLFNLLPIYPLDGGRVLHALCIHFLPYTFANKSTFIISCIVLLFTFLNMHSYWFIVFGILYVFYVYREFDGLLLRRMRFYYNRYLMSFSLPCKVHNIKDLYQDYDNIIVSDRRYDEKQWLSRFFSKKFP